MPGRTRAQVRGSETASTRIPVRGRMAWLLNQGRRTRDMTEERRPESPPTTEGFGGSTAIKKAAFLTGVFLITFSVLVFQIVQTRILSVIAWYYLAFFAISVAMLGMTIGAVWVYLRREQFLPVQLASDLSRYALATAVSIPASLMVQFSLVTTVALSVSTIVSW